MEGAIKLKDPVGLGDLGIPSHFGGSWQAKQNKARSVAEPKTGCWKISGHRTRLSTFFACLEAFIANRQSTKKGKAVLCSHSEQDRRVLTSTGGKVGQLKECFEDLLSIPLIPDNSPLAGH